jgi:hypothetical protein
MQYLLLPWPEVGVALIKSGGEWKADPFFPVMQIATRVVSVNPVGAQIQVKGWFSLESSRFESSGLERIFLFFL